MIRFRTDINIDARELFTGQMSREKTTMRALGISLCVAFTTWMVGAGILAMFSREIAEFIVDRQWL